MTPLPEPAAAGPPDPPTDEFAVALRPGPRMAAVLVPAAVGVAVSVALGVYGRVHEPADFAINVAGFSGPLYVKAWLTTLAAALAVVQVLSAAALYGKLPLRAPSWTGILHRWSGRAAVLATVPVAVHCLYALGFQAAEPRVWVHALVGCAFYGAFVAKMLLLVRDDTPGWALPAAGAAVFTGLVVLCTTSALWVFSTLGLRL
jgi:Family of unknown function (DUF6529)